MAMSQVHEGFPWAYSLGQLSQLSNSGPQLPALWPTLAGGLWLRVAAESETAAAQALEATALDLFANLPWQALSVQVFDFGIRKRFPALAQLQAMGLYRIFHDAPEAQKGLAELERLARHRHHQLLDADTPTITAYNQSVPRPEPYVLVVLNVDDFPQDAGTTQRLSALLQEAPAAGIHVLAFSRWIAPEPDSGNDPAQRVTPPAEKVPPLAATLRVLYPELLVEQGEAPDTAATLRILGGPGSQDLAAVISHHDLALNLPSQDLAAQLSVMRERALAEESHSDKQDFLHVPVGQTLDGRSTIYWSMGERSNCYNALMLGMPGTGKSTLLNNLIVGIAEQYTADEVRLNLMDYKDGVEFQLFDQHPNVERIFLDNEDTAAATQLLQEFAATIRQRNELFKSMRANIRNLNDYNRHCPDQPLPRIILVVDEAQRLLTGNSVQSQRLADNLVDVTRRGRSTGIHIVLSTQSLSGVSDVRKLLVATSMRASFKINSPTDSEGVMDSGNLAPLTLKPFEFVLNLQDGNKSFNQLGLGLPPPDVTARLAAVRAKRPKHLCIQAKVFQSAEQKQAQSEKPSAPVPDWLGQTPAPSPVDTPEIPAQTAKPESGAEMDILEKMRLLRGIVPNL